MKILFVCKANTGRSQMAEAFYNHIHPNCAKSAGTMVDIPGEKLSSRKKGINTLAVMKEIGFDISDNVRTEVTRKMLDDFDKVIVMAEPYTLPHYLINNPKVDYWNVENPVFMSIDDTRKIRDEIIKKVKSLK